MHSLGFEGCCDGILLRSLPLIYTLSCYPAELIMPLKQEKRYEMINSLLLLLLFLSLGNLSSTSFCTQALSFTSSSVIAFTTICSERDSTLNQLR